MFGERLGEDIFV